VPTIEGYEITHELHRGGQGIVYAGVQRSTGRDAAIKVLLRGELATPRQRARFEREIGLLAALDSPGIVTVFDRAETDDGRTALVMELIRGVPIDEHVRDRGLGPREILRLFADLSEVVAEAHRRGVIHRDLKPGNVLVDGQGRPRVLDFGLAKTVEDQQARATHATLDGEFMGTLAYAAPEQFELGSADADVRADVYAIGAMLYEALAGRPPVDVAGPVGVAISRVREQTPARPSALGVPIARDVETVVMTALEKDRDRRYDSAGALAADLRRCLRDEPIAARPPSTAYLLSKFARRNPGIVTAALVAVIALVGATAAVSVALVRTNAARRAESAALTRAETEADKQARINAFLRQMLTSVDPGRAGRDMRVTDLLDDAVGRIPGEFAEYPVLRAGLHATLGETAWRLGDIRRAEEQVTTAAEILRLMSSDEARLELGRTLALLGGVHLTAQRSDDARAALAEASEIVGLAAPGDTLLRAKIDTNIAAVELQAGETARADALLGDVLERLGGLESVEAERLRLQAMVSRGVALSRLGRVGAALELYDRALPLLETHRGPTHPDTLACRSNRAEALWDLERHAEALEEMRELLVQRREVFGPDHERVGIAANNLADALRQIGRYDEAAPLYGEAIRVFKGALGEENMRVASVTHNLGVMLLDRGDPDAALARLGAAAALAGRLLPEGHWIVAQFELREGEAMLRLGRRDEALRLIRASHDRLLGSLGPDHERVERAAALLAEAEG